jgi:hypothetical protein
VTDIRRDVHPKLIARFDQSRVRAQTEAAADAIIRSTVEREDLKQSTHGPRQVTGRRLCGVDRSRYSTCSSSLRSFGTGVCE